VNQPAGPCAIYARGVAYSDEVYFVDPDPMLDAALRTWRSSGDPDEVLSLLQHQDENNEYPDYLVSVHPTFAEAQAAFTDALNGLLRTLTFVDFGFASFGIGHYFSGRWYSTEDDDDKWSELLDSDGPAIEPTDDLARLLDWCDQNGVTRPTAKNRPQLDGIAARAMQAGWDGPNNDQTDVFLADVVVEQLRATNREDLIADLWATLVGQLAFIGPAPSNKPVEFDLRKMSFFRERNIDTSGFSATSLDGNAPVTQPVERLIEKPVDQPAKKGLFGRIFGK
jgi:hypothetical protein